MRGAVVVAVMFSTLALAWTWASESEVELVIVLLTTSLTIVTLVLTLAYEPASKWPPVRFIVPRRDVILVATSAVLSVVSLLAPVGSAAQRLGAHLGGMNQLAPVSIPVGLAGFTFALSTVTAIRLLVESGGRARRSASARLLASSWSAAHQASRGRAPLARRERPIDMAFESDLRDAMTNNDVSRIIDRINEVGDAAHHHAQLIRDPEDLRYALLADQRVTGLSLAWLVRNPEAARSVGGTICEQLIRSSAARADRLSGSLTVEVQRDAATHLGRLARYYGWAQNAAVSQGSHSAGFDSYITLIRATQSARRQLLTMVDPDPPGLFISSPRPWSRGLSSPEAMTLFLWGLAEPMPTDFGVSLYALHEVLLGRKFAGSFSTSEVCVLSSIERASEAGQAPDGTGELLAKVGGVRRMAADLLTSHVASWPTRGRSAPRDLIGDLSFGPPAYRRAKEVRWFTLAEDIRVSNAEEGLDELARSLSTSALPGSAPSFAGWATTEYRNHARRFGLDVLTIPTPLPSERYVATAIATLLRLMPHDADQTNREAVRFLRMLPPRLVSDMHAFCSREDMAGLGPGDPDEIQGLVAMLSFLQETEI